MNAPPLSILRDAREIRNYVLPGLTSYLLAESADGSKVRVLHSEIEQHEAVTPHSHRFDFECFVLRGSVTQTLWIEETEPWEDGDLYLRSTLSYGGAPGSYEVARESQPTRWRTSAATYAEGEEYGMRSFEVHSIRFGRGAAVLFREGPPLTQKSVILEPWCGGARIPTFRVEPWMSIAGSRDSAPSADASAPGSECPVATRSAGESFDPTTESAHEMRDADRGGSDAAAGY